MQLKKNILVYIICLYLVGTALYSLANMLWSAPDGLLIKAFIFQILKISAGITLFVRFYLAPYIMTAVLLWSVVITGIGFYVQPITEQSNFIIFYVGTSLLFLLCLVLYSFYLKRNGYFKAGKNA